MTNIQIRTQTRTRTSQTARIIRIGCYGLLVSLLSGCGSSDQASVPSPDAAARVAKSAGVVAKAKDPLADMVKAVPNAAGENPVELRFELPKQPILGEPFDINLNILSLADVSGLELKVTPQPEITVINGGGSSFGALKTGESVRHTLQLRAPAAGIFVIDVKIVATVGDKPDTAEFSIPVALIAAPAEAVAAAGK